MIDLVENLPTTKRPKNDEDKRFTSHLKQLAGKKPHVIKEIYDSCQPKKRDLARRCYGKVYSRYLAAKFLLELGNPEKEIDAAKLNLFLDRTEGKVAEIHVQVDGKEFVEQLEAARQRVLSGYNPTTLSLQSIEPAVLTGHALDQQSSVMPAPAAPTPRGQAQGPIGGVESHSIPPLSSEDAE